MKYLLIIITVIIVILLVYFGVNKYFYKSGGKSNELKDSPVYIQQMTGRILCFGDSLTAGFMDGGFKYWPYTNKLQKLLDDKYGPIYEVVCRGYPGDTVTNDFKSKFSGELKKEVDDPFLAVLLLGGTNDMAYGKSADEITHSLDTLYTEAEETGAKVFVLSVPDCKYGISRKDLNNKLRELAVQKDHIFVNINDALPITDKSLWNDGLHCSEVGYDIMADTVFLELADFLDET